MWFEEKLRRESGRGRDVGPRREAALDALGNAGERRSADEFLQLNEGVGADEGISHGEELVVVGVRGADGDLLAVAAHYERHRVYLRRKVLVKKLPVHPRLVDGLLDGHVRRLGFDDEDRIAVEEDDVIWDIALGQRRLVDERQDAQRLFRQDGLGGDFEEARVREQRHNELLLDVALRREIVLRDGQQAHGWAAPVSAVNGCD
jgi:hypothetical protein